MKNSPLLILLLLLPLLSPVRAQSGAQKLKPLGSPSSYPTVVYSQSVVSNPSLAYNNVVNLHWKKGSGTNYVVLAGRYLQRSPYNGTYPTPTPPFSPAPAGPGNGYLDANSLLPAYPASDEVAPHLIKTGDYTRNPADTTAQVLNALPGETYYAYIWEYTVDANGSHVLSPPANSNLSWQALFTQFHAAPTLTSVTLDALKRPVLTWTTAVEDTVAGFRITQGPDSMTTNGTLSSPTRVTRTSTVTPNGFATTVSTYTQTLSSPLAGVNYFQVTQYLSNRSTYVPNEPFWSRVLKAGAKPLPVTLVGMSARRPVSSQARVLAEWSTAAELTNKGFELERSLDGIHYATVAYVTGNGTSSVRHDYSAADSCRRGAYYRLAQIDFSDLRSYGPVCFVAGMMETLARLDLYPNPGQGLINLSGGAADQPTLVFNALGQRIRVLPAGTLRFEATNWPRGVYLVRQGLLHARFVLE